MRKGATVFTAGLKAGGVVGDFSEDDAVRLMDETASSPAPTPYPLTPNP